MVPASVTAALLLMLKVACYLLWCTEEATAQPVAPPFTGTRLIASATVAFVAPAVDVVIVVHAAMVPHRSREALAPVARSSFAIHHAKAPSVWYGDNGLARGVFMNGEMNQHTVPEPSRMYTGSPPFLAGR